MKEWKSKYIEFLKLITIDGFDVNSKQNISIIAA